MLEETELNSQRQSRTQPTDEELMERVKRSDAEAFGILFGRCWQRTLTLCASYLPTQSMAEECAQQTMLQVWQGRRGYESRGRFRSWLCRITKNVCFDALRKLMNQRDLRGAVDQRSSLYTVAVSPDSTPGTRVVRRDQIRWMMLALDNLSQPHREVLVLRFFQDLSLQEIADIADVPVGTVKSRLHHALVLLREQFETLVL